MCPVWIRHPGQDGVAPAWYFEWLLPLESKNEAFLEMCICCIFSRLLLNIQFGPGSSRACSGWIFLFSCGFSSCSGEAEPAGWWQGVEAGKIYLSRSLPCRCVLSARAWLVPVASQSLQDCRGVLESPSSANLLGDACSDPVALIYSFLFPEQGEEVGPGLATMQGMLRLASCLLLFSCGITQISLLSDCC